MPASILSGSRQRFSRRCHRWPAVLRACMRLISLGCAIAHGEAFAGVAVPFDRAAWQSDYVVLKHALEDAYANLAWFASPASGVDLPALDRGTQQQLDGARDDAQARAVLLAFVAAFHDGHFSALPVREPAAESSDEPPRAKLDILDAAGGCAALGYAVTRSTAFSLPFESLPGFTLLSDGIDTPFRAGVLDAGDGVRLALVRIAYFRQSEAAVLCRSEWTSLRSEGRPIDPAALRERVDAAWFAALADRLRDFAGRHAAAVLVDVGDNGGGNDAGDWTARLFTPKPVHSARLWMAAAGDASDYVAEQIKALESAESAQAGADADARSAADRAKADFVARRDAIAARRCDLSWAWREQRAWKPAGCSRLLDMGYASGAVDYQPAGAFGGREIASALYWPAVVDAQRGAWSGPVYVLSNAKTYSSAEMFTAVMKDNGIARTLGATTGGDGCGFMQDVVPLELVHSHLRFRIPDCVRLRADGSDEVAGIAPDQPIDARANESERARAARTLEVIADDLDARANR